MGQDARSASRLKTEHGSISSPPLHLKAPPFPGKEEQGGKSAEVRLFFAMEGKWELEDHSANGNPQEQLL